MQATATILIGSIMTATVATVSLNEMNSSIPDPFKDMTITEFNEMVGVSDLVYDCVNDVLQGENSEGIVNFIENEAHTAGTPEETLRASEIKQCIYQDPFGWHGTENEWAIELLETDTWE